MPRPVSHLSLVSPIPRSAPSLALTVPAAAAAMSGVRRAVVEVARAAGLDEERCADVALAVGEACANAVVHAYAGEERGVVRATAHTTSDGLEVVIADDGRGLAPRPDSPGLGLGLPLIAALATQLDVRVGPAGGTELWMLFATDDADDAGAALTRTA